MTVNPILKYYHIPNITLVSNDIKLGYLDSLVLPSSIVAKEYNVGGSQPESPVLKSTYISLTIF